MWFENHPPLQWQTHTLADGRQLDVPEMIVRHAEAGQPGWQLRFGDWTFYPDGDGADGAANALATAVADMQERIAYRGK